VEAIEVHLEDVKAFNEIAERCRVRVAATSDKNGGTVVKAFIELDVTDESKKRPNAPVRIDVVADDGSILGQMKPEGGSSGSRRIVQNSTFTIELPSDRSIRGLTFHMVRQVEWHDHDFAFENVPLR
jgi:hypothetical protein